MVARRRIRRRGDGQRRRAGRGRKRLPQRLATGRRNAIELEGDGLARGRLAWTQLVDGRELSVGAP